MRGFAAGGVDYVGKPYIPEELLARINVHVELRRARREIRQLRSIIPICAKCKKIRNVEGMWQEIEQYIEAHTDALFSHSLCQNCADDLYGGQDWYEKKKTSKK